MTLVNCDHPIVWEMLVHNFSHLRILLFKDFRDKAEHQEDYGSLLGKCYGSMLWIRISRKLAVDIVIFDSVYQMFSEYSIYGES